MALIAGLAWATVASAQDGRVGVDRAGEGSMLRRLLLIFGAAALVVGVWTAVGGTGQPVNGLCPSPSPTSSIPGTSSVPGPSPTASPSPLASPSCSPAYPLNVAVGQPANGDQAAPPQSESSRSGLSAGTIAVFLMGFVLPVAVAAVVSARRARPGQTE